MKTRKKYLLFAVIGMLAGSVYASVVTTSLQETDKALAKVNRVDGYYVFVQCTPVAQYEILGTVKRSGTFQMSNSPESMYNGIIKRVKKEFPKADGIIFDGADMEKASCIQFK